MTINLRVARDFMNEPANDLANTTDNVVAGLTSNPAYPDAPVPPPDLADLNTTLRTSITAADAGGKEQTQAMYNAYNAVTDALRKNANYVEIHCNNDMETLLSSGFQPVNMNRAQAPLIQPVIAQIANNGSAQVLLRLNKVINAKTYQVQIATAVNGPWTEAGIYTQARRIVLLNLTPGTMYYVRVRAVGGSTGYSDWSVTANIMAT